MRNLQPAPTHLAGSLPLVPDQVVQPQAHHLTRLDPINDWIDPVLDGENPPDPCAGVTSQGQCEDNVAVSCRNYVIERIDCTEYGTACGWIEESSRYGCPCGNLPEEGRCDGEIRESCRRGRISAYSCASRGTRCGWEESEARYTCLDRPSCRLQDELGRCEGEVAINCDSARTTRDICFVDERLCTETDDGAVCLLPESDRDAGPGAPGDAGSEIVEEGGCGCKSARRPATRTAWAALLLSTPGWVLRRSRTAHPNRNP